MKEDKPDSAAAAALNLSPNGIGSINMSVEINGTIYAGEKEPLPGRGREPGWWGRVGWEEGDVLPSLPKLNIHRLRKFSRR